MAKFRFWEWLRFQNPLGCCLPSPPPHFQNDDVQQQLLRSTPSPTLKLCSKSDAIDIAIEQVIIDGFLGREKRRPKMVQVDPRSRAQCIDCLIDAAEKLHCSGSTLHLAVNYLDRYLSTNQFDYLGRYLSGEELEIEDFRFVGLTCLMIASKYDGVRDEFQFDAYLGLCKSVVSRGDLIRMEKRILSCLRYEMAAPTTWTFLERYFVTQREVWCMATYFAEVSLLSPRMLPFLPSMVAESSLFLAHYVLEPSKKPPCVMYRRSDLRDCVLALHDCCYGNSSHYLPAITIKYSKKKYDYVALKNSPPFIPLHIFQD